MEPIAKTIVELDPATLAPKPAGTLERLDIETVLGDKRLKEGHFDRLIIENTEALTELLREWDFFGEDDELRAIKPRDPKKRQFRHVDVMLAHVDGDEEFRRWVLVEDKLVRNRESRRKVLAQIFDYETDLTRKGRAEELIAWAHDDEREWLEENQDAIQESFDRGDFLLMIAGDRIDPNLVRLAKSFTARLDPLHLSELVLVSLALYQDAAKERAILVPAVVGAIEKESRPWTLRVEVQLPDGTSVPAQTSLDQSDPKAATGPKRARSAPKHDTPEAYLDGLRPAVSDAAIEAGHAFFEKLSEADIAGLEVGHTRNGHYRVTLRCGDETPSILGVQGSRKKGTLEVTSAILRRECLMRSEPIAKAVREMTKFFETIEGSRTTGSGNRHRLPVLAVGERLEELLEYMRALAKTVRAQS